jgi:hypothetical protein
MIGGVWARSAVPDMNSSHAPSADIARAWDIDRKRGGIIFVLSTARTGPTGLENVVRTVWTSERTARGFGLVTHRRTDRADLLTLG